jgi:epoxyqueuosine reductase
MFLGSIKRQLDDYLLGSPDNLVADLDGMRIFDPCLLAVASTDDALWEKLKQPDVIGPPHLSPAEWLEGAQSVICCFLPYTSRVRFANRRKGWPATEWLYGRYEGAMFVDVICRFLVDTLLKTGTRAIAPALDSRFAVVDRRSNWSERHAAFVAGLGTFSLNRSLITELGSAGRLFSVVTELALKPTPRPYTRFDEYCTKCGACIRRCPPRAVDENGKDNAACSEYLQKTRQRYQPRYGCGKCQTAVPCEGGRPSIPNAKAAKPGSTAR